MRRILLPLLIQLTCIATAAAQNIISFGNDGKAQNAYTKKDAADLINKMMNQFPRYP